MATNKRFYKILFLEILAVLLIASFFFIDQEKMYKWFAGETHFSESINPCDLHMSACTTTLTDGNSVTFSIEPKTIPLMKPLTFRVQTFGIEDEEIDLSIYATNMNMGLHTFTMKKVSNGLYEAKGILPTCIVGNMIWRAEVVLNRPTQSIGAAYTFKTDQ